MVKPRNKENKGLPKGWRFFHGAYRYRVPKGKESMWDGKTQFKLGVKLSDAYKVWAARIGEIESRKFVGDLLDRYLLEVIPTKAPKTQEDNKSYVKRLRKSFGHMPVADIRPVDIYQYYEARVAKIAAKREIALLSHALTKGVEWDFIQRHPFKREVRLEGEQPRKRYVKDDEIIQCLALPSLRKRGSVHAIQSYIRLKLLTGLRRGDLLRLRVGDCREDGIHVNTRKTGKPVIYEWSGELRNAVEGARAARPVDISPYLFCTKYGEPYIDENGNASSWNSMWQRFMARVLKETEVEERFTEHDLRAKVGSDAESLERARQLLSHADSKITNRVYRRKPEVIRPAK